MSRSGQPQRMRGRPARDPLRCVCVNPPATGATTSLAALLCLLVGSMLVGFGTISVFLLESAHVAAARSADEAPRAIDSAVSDTADERPPTEESAADKKGSGDQKESAKMRLFALGILLIGSLLLFAGLSSRTGGMRIGASILVALAADVGAAAGGWLRSGVVGVGLLLALACGILAALAVRALRRARRAT